ncbi:ABC transporter ATP-binding protein [Paenibacillus sp. y28]|uniref:ABC transporter ATP-binding protein n=1 Tax=Paenibacillus sp. y28 TaxID=3129110 RepID=UPI0030176A44
MTLPAKNASNLASHSQSAHPAFTEESSTGDTTTSRSPASRSATAKISVKAVGKVFVTTKPKQQFQALAGISFDVQDGEFVSIVGPSGCGKSTLLRILAGLEDMSEGTIEVSGKRIDGPGADRGMVFQSYTLYPWLTVRENIEFGLTLKKTPLFEKRAIADRFMELVSLTRFAKSFPKELSGGMKQRVAIARALANNPEVLLMDEPFGALDPQTKENMQEMLLNIWKKEGMTVVFITHDIEEAVYLSQRIIVLDAHPGRIRQEFQVPAQLKTAGRDSAAFLQFKKQVVSVIGHQHD